MLLSAENITVRLGGKTLLENVTLYLERGDKIGIIGVNGAGKSTFLRTLAGVLEPDDGSVTLDPNVRLSYLPQIPDMTDSLTVLDQVFEHYSPEVRELEAYEAKTMLTRLGITDFDQKVGTLSGGQRKRVALAAVLLHPADILVLDEPTNHLDNDMVIWLEDRLRRWNGGLVMVTHDRYFLDRVTNSIAEISHRSLYRYKANYSRYLELKAEREEMAEATERRRQSILRTEYKWVMRGAQARRTKNKDRLARYDELKNQSAPEQDGEVSISAVTSRLGRDTVELRHVSKAFGGKTVLRDFSCILGHDDRIGVIGPNGAGKSTLLNLITGNLAPDSGEVIIGQTVRFGYFSQEGREMDPRQRVWDYVHEAADVGRRLSGAEISPARMMEQFLFPPEMQSAFIGDLSGGERRRLYLLGVLLGAPNILLLDEPTNDLDILTLSALEEYLATFSGPVIAVAHDRYFLDKTVTQIFEVRDGEVRRYTGAFSDYLEKRPPEEKPAAAEPEKKPVFVPVPSEAPKVKKKFSFKEQREYETIESDIAALEEQLDAVHRDQELYCSDYVRLQELKETEDALSAALEEKMERWEYLEELAEQIKK